MYRFLANGKWTFAGWRSGRDSWRPGGRYAARFSPLKKKNDERFRAFFVAKIALTWAIAVIGKPKPLTTKDTKEHRGENSLGRAIYRKGRRGRKEIGGGGLGQTHAKLGYLGMNREG